MAIQRNDPHEFLNSSFTADWANSASVDIGNTKHLSDIEETVKVKTTPKLDIIATAGMRELLKEKLPTSICTGAAIGAISLMAFGPAGAGIGAIVGGVLGVIQGKDFSAHLLSMNADPSTHARVDPFYVDTDMYDEPNDGPGFYENPIDDTGDYY